MKVILSHSTKDKKFVQTLAAELEAENIQSWICEVDVEFGGNFVARIEEDLRDADLTVVFWSPSSASTATISWACAKAALAENQDSSLILYKARSKLAQQRTPEFHSTPSARSYSPHLLWLLEPETIEYVKTIRPFGFNPHQAAIVEKALRLVHPHQPSSKHAGASLKTPNENQRLSLTLSAPISAAKLPHLFSRFDHTKCSAGFFNNGIGSGWMGFG